MLDSDHRYDSVEDFLLKYSFSFPIKDIMCYHFS